MEKAVTNALIETVSVEVMDIPKFNDVKKSNTIISKNYNQQHVQSRIPKKTEPQSQNFKKKVLIPKVNTPKAEGLQDKPLRISKFTKPVTKIPSSTEIMKTDKKKAVPPNRTTSKMSLTISRTVPRIDKALPNTSISKMSLNIPKILPRSEKLASNRSKSKFNLNISPNTARIGDEKAEDRLKFQKSLSCIGEDRKVKPSGFHTERGLSSGTSSIESATSIIKPKKKTNYSAKDRFSEKININLFEDTHRKLQVTQAQFLKRYDLVKDILNNKQNIEYKLVVMQKDSKQKLLLKDQEEDVATPKQSMKPVLENPLNLHDVKSNLELFIEQNIKYIIGSLETAFKEKCAGDSPSSLVEGPNYFAKCITEFRNKLERDKNQQVEDILKKLENCIATEGAVNTDLENQANHLQKELQESKKMLQLHEKQVKDLKRLSEEAVGKLNKDLTTKEKILSQKETELTEIQKKYRHLESDLNKKKATSNKLLQEYQAKADKLEKEIQQQKESSDKSVERIRYLQDQLKAEKKARSDNEEKLKEQELAVAKATADLNELRTKSKAVQFHSDEGNTEENVVVDNAKSSNGTSAIVGQNEMLKREVDHLKSQIAIANGMIDKLTAADGEAKKCIADLELKIEAYANQMPVKEVPKEVQNELIKLRNAESDKRRENEKLKSELARARFEIQQLEERVQCDQQLLKVRSELISSLQSNEKSHRIHLDELFVNMAEKNNTISENYANDLQLDNELQTKTEEFHNLFSTLSTKQLELSRQAHMIKLLEESNDRSQILRVKQEEKIARMGEEIIQLKQSLDFYRDPVVSNNSNRKNPLFNSPYLNGGKMDSEEQCKDNLYYYTAERQRKRHVDINVKKYEV